ncbi:unnamed protein product, partial [Clonostachys byssicola]
VVGLEKCAVMFLTGVRLVRTVGWMARLVSKRKDVQKLAKKAMLPSSCLGCPGFVALTNNLTFEHA